MQNISHHEVRARILKLIAKSIKMPNSNSRLAALHCHVSKNCDFWTKTAIFGYEMAISGDF